MSHLSRFGLRRGFAATLLLLGVTFGAASANAQGAGTTASAADCKPLQVARQFLDRIGMLDLEGIMALLDDNLDMQDPWGNKMTKAQLRAWYVEEFPKMTKQRTTRIVGTTCEGERVAIESVSSRQLEDGTTYGNIYHHLFVVRNGKVVAYHQYLNTEAFTKAVKMTPDYARPQPGECEARTLGIRYMEMIAARDIDGAMKLLDDGVKFQDAWGRVVDKAAIRAWYDTVFPRLGPPRAVRPPRDDGKPTGVVGTMCEGDRAMVESTGSTVLSDGSHYQNVFIYTFRVANGKIVEMHEYTDTDLAKMLFPDVKDRAIRGQRVRG